MRRHSNKQDKPPYRNVHYSPALLACILSASSGACDRVQDAGAAAPDRAAPPVATMSLLETPLRMLYPDGVQTVAEALSYMLAPHNYRAANRSPAGELMAQRRFINNFSVDPVPLRLAIPRLIGANGQIVLDNDSRLYAYRQKPADAPGIVFAKLTDEPFGDPVSALEDAGLRPADQPRPQVAEPGSREASANHATWRPVDPVAVEAETTPGRTGKSCHAIQFRNRTMLSATVRQYFLECGFEEVFWRLGKPGSYADYRLTQNTDVPLPERHLDLIELLQTRFGIKTLINKDNSVEFHDENSTF